jgi:hypothetical protein
LFAERPRAALLFSFPLLYVGFLLLPGHTFFARYLLPVTPFFALAATAALSALTERLPFRPAARAAATAAGLAIALAQARRRDCSATITPGRRCLT